MKLRIRYSGKTKIIALEDQPSPTIDILKRSIKQDIFPEWEIDEDTEFDLSLDGKTSVGAGCSVLKDSGIVSGDLIKLIMGAGNVVTAENDPVVITPEPAVSSMSVQENETAGPSTEGVERVEEIPCLSPGPIFFRECDGVSQVPHQVQKIYENDNIQNEFQAACIVLHFMMRESGFYIEAYTEDEDILQLLKPRVFEASYTHSAGGRLKLNFVCTPLGPYILINSVVEPCENTEDQILTLQVATKEFIVDKFNSSNKNSNASAVYKNLSKLNRLVKETISHPAMNHMREEQCLPPLHGLLALFPEILNYVLSFLDSKSLAALGQVNKALNDISNDDNLWRNLYIKDFKAHPITTLSSWKEMYANRYKQQRERAQEFERFRRSHDRDRLFPDQFQDPQFPPYFPNQPFGMIGGEHDLHPSFPYGPFANPNRRLPPGRPHPSNPDNPLPGSRFDPIYPGGAFRPGRGGGMQDIDSFEAGLREGGRSRRGLGGDGLEDPGSLGFGLPRRPGGRRFDHRHDYI